MPDKTLQSDSSVVPNIAFMRANMAPKGYQQITLVGASSLTPPAGARIALLQAEVQNARWRDDGVDPTATVGMLLLVGASIEIWGDLSKYRLIAATAGSIVNVAYYG